AWIAVIAKSKSKDLLRKKLRRTTIFHHYTEELQATSPLTPETATIKKFERAELHKAVKQLPDNQQRALIASYIENKTHQECAANWQVPLGTVKSWIRYGLNNLRKQ